LRTCIKIIADSSLGSLDLSVEFDHKCDKCRGEAWLNRLIVAVLVRLGKVLDLHPFRADLYPDPGFKIYAEPDPDPRLDFFQKLIFFTWKSKKRILGPDQNADPDPGTQICGYFADLDPKPCVLDRIRLISVRIRSISDLYGIRQLRRDQSVIRI